jgi:hypothetical protein
VQDEGCAGRACDRKVTRCRSRAQEASRRFSDAVRRRRAAVCISPASITLCCAAAPRQRGEHAAAAGACSARQPRHPGAEESEKRTHSAPAAPPLRPRPEQAQGAFPPSCVVLPPRGIRPRLRPTRRLLCSTKAAAAPNERRQACLLCTACRLRMLHGGLPPVPPLHAFGTAPIRSARGVLPLEGQEEQRPEGH